MKYDCTIFIDISEIKDSEFARVVQVIIDGTPTDFCPNSIDFTWTRL